MGSGYTNQLYAGLDKWNYTAVYKPLVTNSVANLTQIFISHVRNLTYQLGVHLPLPAVCMHGVATGVCKTSNMEI